MDDEAKRRPSPSRRTPSLGNGTVMIKDQDCDAVADDDDDNGDEDGNGDYERFTSQCAEYGGGGGGSGGCSHNGPPVKIMVSKSILAMTIPTMITGDDDVS